MKSDLKGVMWWVAPLSNIHRSCFAAYKATSLDSSTPAMEAGECSRTCAWTAELLPTLFPIVLLQFPFNCSAPVSCRSRLEACKIECNASYEVGNKVYVVVEGTALASVAKRGPNVGLLSKNDKGAAIVAAEAAGEVGKAARAVVVAIEVAETPKVADAAEAAK